MLWLIHEKLHLQQIIFCDFSIITLREIYIKRTF